MSCRQLLVAAFLATCQGLVLQPAVRTAVAVRPDATCAAPMMFGGAKKAAPKKVAKKVVKKAPKKVVKKVVKKAAPKKVVKKAVAKKPVAKKGGVKGWGDKKTPSDAIQGFSGNFFSANNWAVQAVKGLGALEKSGGGKVRKGISFRG